MLGRASALVFICEKKPVVNLLFRFKPRGQLKAVAIEGSLLDCRDASTLHRMHGRNRSNNSDGRWSNHYRSGAPATSRRRSLIHDHRLRRRRARYAQPLSSKIAF
jgi:hypothetical protein